MPLLRVVGGHHFFESPELIEADQSACIGYNKMLTLVVLTLFSYGVGLVTSYVLLFYFLPGFYGGVMFAQQVLICVSTVLLRGTKSLTKRFMAQYLISAQKHFAHYVWWHVSYLCQAMLLFTILYSSTVYVLVYLDYIDFISLSHFHMAFWTLVVAPFYAFFMITSVYLLVFGHAALYDFCSLVLANTVLILLSLGWSMLSSYPDLWVMISLVVAQSICLLIILCALIFFLLPGPLREVLQFNHIIQVEPEWSRHPVSALMTDVYGSLLTCCSLFVIALFTHSKSMLGDFSLCVVMSSIFSSLSKSLYPLAYASLGRLMANDRMSDYRPLLLRVNRSVFCLSLVVLLVFFYFGHSMLAIFGRDSDTTYWMLLGLSVASWLMGLYYRLMNVAMIGKGLESFVGLMHWIFYICLVFFGSFVFYLCGVNGFVVFYIGLMASQLLIAIFKFHSVSGYHVLVLW